MADVPSISLDPYLAGVQATLFGLQQLGLIPSLDPLDYIIGAFDGKPKLEDTYQAALRLEASPWWPLRALGANLMIWVRNGVPLSTGNLTYRAQLSEWIRGTIDSIEPIVYNRLDPYTLDHAIWLSMTSQQGDTAIVQLNNTIAQQHALGPLPPLPNAQPTGPPPPPPLPGSQAILTSVDGDTLFDIGSTLNFTLTEIYNQLLLMGTAMQRPTDDTCCTNVVAAISNVVGQLTIIGAALANPQPTQVTLDFTPLTGAVSSLVTAVNAYPPALQACCAAINTSLGGIRDAITAANTTDVSGIVEQLKLLVKEGDVDDKVFQALQQQGLLNGEDLQTLQGDIWSNALSYIHGIRAWRTLEKAGKTVEADYTAINNWLINFSAKADTWASKEVKKGLTTERNLIQSAITPILDLIKSALTPTGPKQIGQIGVNPDTVIADVAAVGLNIQTVAALISLVREGAGERISKIGEVVTGLLGFEELREVQLGPLVNHGIAKIADMQAKKLFGQELPGPGSLASLEARGLISAQQYFTWIPYTGLPGELWEQTRQAAYHGLGARRMMQLINTGLFSQAEIQDELTFSGIRPLSQQRMLTAAPYLATQPQRHALWATLEKAYVAGLLDDPGLTSNIDSANQNTNRDNLILQKVRWDVLIEETKGLTTEYTTLFLGSVIDDPTYRSYLSGIGLQPWKVNLEASKAEARAAATLQRKAIAQAAALQRATAAEERKAAMRNFTDGNIDAAALGLALVATGLTATQAVAWVDLATLQKAGGLHWIYGLQLPAAQATLLRERVAALTDQRKRLQITDAQYVSALQALNIPPNVINALQAAADALLSPRKFAFAIPVQTT
jgi:hypothetical protein